MAQTFTRCFRAPLLQLPSETLVVTRETESHCFGPNQPLSAKTVYLITCSDSWTWLWVTNSWLKIKSPSKQFWFQTSRTFKNLKGQTLKKERKRKKVSALTAGARKSFCCGSRVYYVRERVSPWVREDASPTGSIPPCSLPQKTALCRQRSSTPCCPGDVALIRKPTSTQWLHGGLSTLSLSWLTHGVLEHTVLFQ